MNRNAYLLLIVGILQGLNAYSQSLAGSNLYYHYDPGAEYEFRFRMINRADSVAVYYQLQINSAGMVDDYSIALERRESYGQRKGDVLNPSVEIIHTSDKRSVAQVKFGREDKSWLLVATVTNKRTAEARLFFRQVDTNYPIDGNLFAQNDILLKPFVVEGAELRTSQNAYIFRYPERFPAASPPFAEKEGKVSPGFQADSLIQTNSTTPFVLQTPGLYLVQEDSTSDRGYAFLVTDSSFPRYTHMDDLTDPLIFVCTKEEFAELRNANGDKAKFDKVILEITNDKERAKTFMRNYFKRVEQANYYFTSYKAGWKTDRGMIFLIFGPPTDVNFTGDTEVWNYKNHKVRFTFVKSGSVYDPDNYVLLRDKRFAETWYYTIDLWRKSRF